MDSKAQGNVGTSKYVLYLAGFVFFYHANEVITRSFPNLFSEAEPQGETSEQIQASMKAMKKSEELWSIYGWFNLLCQVVSGGWFNGLEQTPNESAMAAPLYRTLSYLDREILVNRM